MKVMKAFTIDLELALKLKKENNASELINRLIERHYSANVEIILGDLDADAKKAKEDLDRAKRIKQGVELRIAQMKADKKNVTFKNPKS